MTDCESIRGKWSTRGKRPNKCPDCKGDMPYEGRAPTWRESPKRHKARCVTTRGDTAKAPPMKRAGWTYSHMTIKGKAA